MPSRLLSLLLGTAAAPPATEAPPSAERAALIADALRIRAEMRERIGVEKLRVLHRLITGRDPE